MATLRNRGDNSSRLKKYLSTNIRNDQRGLGHFGASRGGGTRTHNGTDYVVTPNEAVYSPISGRVKRTGFAYPNDTRFRLIVIENGTTEVKILYVAPFQDLVGKEISQGQLIGRAQDVRQKYPALTGMIPHIHVELRENGVLKDFNKEFNG